MSSLVYGVGMESVLKWIGSSMEKEEVRAIPKTPGEERKTRSRAYRNDSNFYTKISKWQPSSAGLAIITFAAGKCACLRKKSAVLSDYSPVE